MLNPLLPWENHPFSINTTSLFRSYKHSPFPEPDLLNHSSSEEHHDNEKETDKLVARVSHDPGTTLSTAGVTLIIKKNGGLTRLLKEDISMITLLDGPYPHSPSSSVLECDHVLLLGGGIDITGLPP
jgi:hypothetical protein